MDGMNYISGEQRPPAMVSRRRDDPPHWRVGVISAVIVGMVLTWIVAVGGVGLLTAHARTHAGAGAMTEISEGP